VTTYGSCKNGRFGGTYHLQHQGEKISELGTTLAVKNGVFWDVTRVPLVRTDVSEELSASIIRVTRNGELGTFAVTSNRRKLRINTCAGC
jgi:hypothetical protein